MFRLMSRAANLFNKPTVSAVLQKEIITYGKPNIALHNVQYCRTFSILQNGSKYSDQQPLSSSKFFNIDTLFSKPILPPNAQQVRTVTKFSLVKGKRKTVKAVLRRFYRLNWGAWIRTRAGRHKHLWKKSHALRKRLKQHVFVNGTQSWLLDSMVTNYWRKPKYYVDDPYEPYHQREEFCKSRRKPMRSEKIYHRKD